jgi:hypothetical protein
MHSYMWNEKQFLCLSESNSLVISCSKYVIRLKLIYNFLCSMLVFTPFA